jgi:magnesium-transporting ATPase (P-type)
MVCEPPSDQIYKFEGVIKTHSGEKISLSAENLLLRGSSLRNTDWVVGAVVYTGHDTRIMRNSVKAKQKFSKLEKMITKSILIIMLIEALICAVAATYATVWNYRYGESTDQYLTLDSWKALEG